MGTKTYHVLKNVDVAISPEGKIYVLGSVPDCEDEGHSCDEMCCSSVEHTLLIGCATRIGVSKFESTISYREE